MPVPETLDEPVEERWNLSEIYADEAAFEADRARAKEAIASSIVSAARLPGDQTRSSPS